MLEVYYINLDRSPERRAFMERQFDTIGVAAKRLKAVDGRDLDPLGHPHSSLSAPERGCLLSHRLAWTSLLESDATFAAVFEDDVRLSRDAGLFLTCLLYTSPSPRDS